MSPTNLYTKKEERVEAIRIIENNIELVASWCGGFVVREPALYDLDKTQWACPYVGLDLKVNGYLVRANLGDYVYRNSKGSFRTMTPKRFIRKYYRDVETRKNPGGHP